MAIIGRPNVGKSTLFNRIVGKRIAITDDMPGVTRDRLYQAAEWDGIPFRLVDTGGYAAWDEGIYPKLITDEVLRAIEEADVIVFLTDAITGVTSADEEVAELLRRTRKPVFLAVNKVDNPKREALGAEFHALGLGEPHTIAALHGIGVGDLLSAAVDALPRWEEGEDESEEDLINIAIIGRPNVGKSTLLNQLLNEKRSMVSSVPGTTRDPVDALLEAEGHRFRLVDTAGIRRRGKPSGVEKFSVMRARQAVKACDVCLLVIDALQGVTTTDAKVFSVVQEEGRAAVILVNKWDAVEKDEKTAIELERDLRERFKFLPYAPIVTISALSGLRTHKILAQVVGCYHGYTQRVPTGELNRFLERILAVKQPARVRGRAPNILYITQVAIKPPTFALFVSNPDALHFSYKRFLVNQLYEAFGFPGTPLVILPRQRG